MDCGLEQKAKADGLGQEGLVGFGLLRGVLPLETHTDSPPPPLPPFDCEICARSTRFLSSALEWPHQIERQQRGRVGGRISCGSSCCQGHGQSEAVLGLGSNVG